MSGLHANRPRVTQALKSAVQTRPKNIATIDGSRQRSWAEVGDRVARGASVLKFLGLETGDRVAILALNSDRYFELLFAVPWAGASVVPMNTRWAEAEIEQALRDCGAKILAVDDQFVEIAALLASRVPGVNLLYIGKAAMSDGFTDYEEALVRHEPGSDLCGGGDDLWAIFYTGGTTGHPKGVMISHANISFAALSWIPSMRLSPAAIYMHAAGMFHIAGAQPAIALTMAGGTQVFLPKFTPEAGLRAISQHRVNDTFLIPTMVTMLLHHPDFESYDLSSLSQVGYGGAPMPDAVLGLALEKLPHCSFIQGYGQTEAAGMMTFLPWERHFGEGAANKRLGTGRAGFGVEMKVADAHGNELPRGQTGEVVTRGQGVMLGYWGRPEASEEVIRDGWLFTGDAGYMDDDGYLFIVDRVKDMIVSGGENIYSKEVENVIYTYAAVRECAVIGIPDDIWGEALHAVVVLKPGYETSQTAIIEHCRGLIGGFKCPRSVEFRTELPVSAAGKILKRSLRNEYWEGKKRNVIR